MIQKSEDNRITYFAMTNFRNENRRFGIKRFDRRRHMYVVGKTGMGKSTLLENLAIQDIQNDEGICVIDPHGEFAQLMIDYVPSHRVNDVVFFNPADVEFPIAFNVMENAGDQQRHLIASGLMGVFKKIWPDVWSARMEYILNNTLLALLEYPNATLLGVNRVLSDKDYRKKVIDNVTDASVKSFWQNEFAKYPDRYREEAVAPILNKIGQLISSPLIRNIIGQTKSTIDMQDIMDSKKILIADLSKGRIGEDASKLLGAILITKVQQAAMARVDIPEEERIDFYLYVDEFQNFATDSFATILSEARKYKLNLLVAHQYIGQLVSDMNTKVRDAVFGNVGTMIAFRVGATDAEFLEAEFQPEFEINDLVNLSFAEIYLKLAIDGVTSQAFSARTLPPIQRGEHTYRDTILKISRERYAKPKAEVEEKITKWSSTPAGTSPASGESGAVTTPIIDKPKFSASCSNCSKQIEVVFEPDGKRPVYCPDCLAKKRAGQINEPAVIKRIVKQEQKKIAKKEKGDLKILAGASDEKIASLSEIAQLTPSKFRKKDKKVPDLSSLRETLAEALSEINHSQTKTSPNREVDEVNNKIADDDWPSEELRMED